MYPNSVAPPSLPYLTPATAKKLSSTFALKSITDLIFHLASDTFFFSLFTDLSASSAVYRKRINPLTSTSLIASSSGTALAVVARAPAARAATKLSFNSFI